MKNKFSMKPVFLGLTHIGQVYSLLWSKKVSTCYVYDYDKNNLLRFKNKKFTQEEPGLKKIRYNKNRLKFLKNENDLKNFDTIFFTYDTPINKNGYPNIKFIEKRLLRLIKLNFKRKTKLIITSQVFPGFLDKLKKKYLKNNKNIDIIYMVDTLKMGSAIDRFLFPEQIILGTDLKNKEYLNELFKKFKCKKIFFGVKEAELIKISINLYLYFSVSYSNILDNLSRQIGLNFSKITESLRNDKRIGKYAYINPSVAISGGHLERDLYYLKLITKSKIIKKLTNNFQKFNDERKNILLEEIRKKNKKKNLKILILGSSYKENSFSNINSIFQEIIKFRNFKVKFYDSFFDINNLGIKNIENNLLKGLNENDFIILNYINRKDLVIIKNFFNNKVNNRFLLNISSKYEKFFKNRENIKNLFPIQKNI